jgi:AcrR family transcriptional regulator
MPPSLQSRKHKLVHDAIYDAAINLFSAKGFEATTVEEVAEAAGVSRRSFFRYFASKDDLLAQGVVTFGDAQVASIQNCPEDLTPIEVVHKTVSEALKLVSDQPRTRDVIAISERSPAAKGAHMSRLMEAEDKIAAAFAARIPGAKCADANPRLLAGLTTLIMGVSLLAWFHGEYDDMQKAAEAVFGDLTQYLSGTAATSHPAAKSPSRL